MSNRQNSVSFLRVTESNIDQLAESISQLDLALNKYTYGPTYWRWRFLNNPAGKGNLVVAVRNNRVIGKYGLCYVHFVGQEKIIRAGLMESLQVYLSERTWYCYRGLVEQSIREEQDDDLAFHFGLSPSHLLELYQRLGVISLGPVPLCIGFLDVTKTLEKYPVPYPLSLAGWFIQPIVGVKLKQERTCNLDFRTIEIFDNSFDQLYETLTNKRTVSIFKNAEYLNWRYVKFPGPCYERLAAYQKEKLEGVVIFQNTTSWKVSFLLEVMARNDNPTIIRFLLSHTFQLLKMKGISHIKALFPVKSTVAAVLKEMGFKSCSRRWWSRDVLSRYNFVFAPNPHREVRVKLDLNNWDFSLGDFMDH